MKVPPFIILKREEANKGNWRSDGGGYRSAEGAGLTISISTRSMIRQGYICHIESKVNSYIKMVTGIIRIGHFSISDKNIFTKIKTII